MKKPLKRLLLPCFDTIIDLFVEDEWGGLYQSYVEKWKLKDYTKTDETNHSGLVIAGNEKNTYRIVIILTRESLKELGINLVAHEVYHVTTVLSGSLKNSIGEEASASIHGWLLSECWNAIGSNGEL